MKKEYLKPTMQVRLSNFDLCKAYPWSDMPATGGYAYPQCKQENEVEGEEEWGKLW